MAKLSWLSLLLQQSTSLLPNRQASTSVAENGERLQRSSSLGPKASRQGHDLCEKSGVDHGAGHTDESSSDQHVRGMKFPEIPSCQAGS